MDGTSKSYRQYLRNPEKLLPITTLRRLKKRKCQQSGLKLADALWTAKSSGSGFSVSLFWPVTAQEKKTLPSRSQLSSPQAVFYYRWKIGLTRRMELDYLMRRMESDYLTRRIELDYLRRRMESDWREWSRTVWREWSQTVWQGECGMTIWRGEGSRTIWQGEWSQTMRRITLGLSTYLPSLFPTFWWCSNQHWSKIVCNIPFCNL